MSKAYSFPEIKPEDMPDFTYLNTLRSLRVAPSAEEMEDYICERTAQAKYPVNTFARFAISG